MGSGVLAEHDPNDHGQAIDISSVIIVFRVGLLGRAKYSGAHAAWVSLRVIGVNYLMLKFLYGQGLQISHFFRQTKIDYFTFFITIYNNIL